MEIEITCMDCGKKEKRNQNAIYCVDCGVNRHNYRRRIEIVKNLAQETPDCYYCRLKEKILKAIEGR